ncbi:MAG: YbaN family protein [Candidatus Bathyarchaeota archaeon]|nr:YbaN family protein [Candidatus Bathyarchaeota archaeon]
MEQESELTKETNTEQKIVRALFFVAGTVSLAVGTIGIVLPILPTTPLLLLALTCYCRSSKRMTKWVLTNKYFGSYIRRYKEGKGIPIKTKIIALAALWITISYSAFFIVNKWWIVQLILFVIAIAVSIHILRLPTYREIKH